MAKHNDCDCNEKQGCNHEAQCDCDEKSVCNHEGQCDCNCEDGCDCDEDLVTLLDDDGNEVKYRYMYNLEHEGTEYVFLQAAEGDEDEVEIYSLHTVEEDGEFYDVLDPVEEELYDVLYEKLLQEAKEYYGDDGCHDEERCHCHEEGASK